jgi:segregation and condensation protein A
MADSLASSQMRRHGRSEGRKGNPSASRTAPSEVGSFFGPLGLIFPPEITIESEVFTGSLGALLHLVREHKVDLLDVPLAPICESFAAYTAEIHPDQLESSAVAATALSYLLEKKAVALLPVRAEAEDFEEAVIPGIDPTIGLFSPGLRALEQRLEDRESLFFRNSAGASAPFELPIDTSAVSGADLALALEKLLSRASPEPIQPLGRPRRSLSEQMRIVAAALDTDFQSLDRIVVGDFTRSEAVWWFLALLELIRLGQARVAMIAGEPCFARGDVPQSAEPQPAEFLSGDEA